MRNNPKSSIKILFIVLLGLAFAVTACQAATDSVPSQTSTPIPVKTEALQPTISQTASATPSPLPANTFTPSPAPSETASLTPTPSATLVNVITPEQNTSGYWLESAYDEAHEEIGIQITKITGEGPFIIFSKTPESIITHYFWSPDGQKVYVINNIDQNTSSVYMISINQADPGKSTSTKIFTGTYLEYVTISPNGLNLAMLDRPINNVPEDQIDKPHLIMLNIPSRQAKTVTFSKMLWPDSIVFSSHPWSSDSNRVVFTARYQPSMDSSEINIDIFLANTAGNVTNLTKPKDNAEKNKAEESAIWPPNQEKIYYYVVSESMIFGVSSKGGQASPLLPANPMLSGWSEPDANSLGISPDGVWLYVPDMKNINNNNQFNPILFNLKDKQTIIMTSEKVMFSPGTRTYWSPDSSQVALVCSPGGIGNGVYCVFDIKSGNFTEVTTVVPSWILKPLDGYKIRSPK